MVARRRKLLLADDSPTIQKVVSLTFSDEGMEVTTVGSGDEALAEIGRARPDVVLADVHMPGVGGYELCERIKRDAALADIPVVLLVGAFEPFSEAEARRVGADEVLTKPFQSIKELVGKVGSLFGGKQTAADARDDAEQTRATESTTAAPPTHADAPRDTRGDGPDARASQSHAFEGATQSDSARGASEPATAFNDFDMDDRMIEARPAEGFGGAASAQATSSEAAAGDDDTTRGVQADEVNQMEMRTQAEEKAVDAASSVDFAHAPGAPEWGGEVEPRALEVERRGVDVERRGVEVEASVADARVAKPVFTTRLASAAAADDALLDLGGMEPPPAVAESDDFILDLDDDSPAAFPTTARTSRESAATSFPFGARADETASRVDTAGAFAEAAHGAGDGAPLFAAGASAAPQAESTAHAYEELTAEVSREPYARDFIEPRVVPAEEPEHPAGAHAVEDLSVEGDIARPPLEPSADAAKPWSHMQARDESQPSASDSRHATRAQQIDAGQFPPEVIEAIARRAVELLSERVVREVAWEVVPELAERLIKQRLDEIAQK